VLVLSGLGVASFEGEQATLAAFVLGPIGAIVGLNAGGWAAQRLFRDPSGIGPVARLAGITLVATAALGAVGVMVSVLFGEPRWTNGAPPRLAFEIRAPVSLADGGAERRWRVNLDTPYNQMPASLASPVVRDGDVFAVSGDVELYYRTSKRLLVLDLGEGRSHVFELRVPATPKASTEWSEWTLLSRVFEPAQPEARKPRGDERTQLRTRLIVF
jgi:hypothetical protein